MGKRMDINGSIHADTEWVREKESKECLYRQKLRTQTQNPDVKTNQISVSVTLDKQAGHVWMSHFLHICKKNFQTNISLQFSQWDLIHYITRAMMIPTRVAPKVK